MYTNDTSIAEWRTATVAAVLLRVATIDLRANRLSDRFHPLLLHGHLGVRKAREPEVKLRRSTPGHGAVDASHGVDLPTRRGYSG